MDSNVSDRQSGVPQGFEVRWVKMNSAEQAALVLPFVRRALETVGFGDVVLVGAGLQLTAPIDLVHNLVKTLEDYQREKPDNSTSNVVSLPPIDVSGLADDIVPSVLQLGLCPPDMRCVLVSNGKLKLLCFAGTSLAADNYKANVLPHVRALVAALDS